MTNGPWQILDVGSIWMREFASAMAAETDIVAWWPVMRPAGALERWERVEHIANPVLEVRRFPLQRGYARPPLRQLWPYENALLRRLLPQDTSRQAPPLICSTPYYAPVAERWLGPVVYYVTDLTAEYPSANRQQVVALDKRLCAAAKVVCPNSARIGDYLVAEAGCSPAKIAVIPNATRAGNVACCPILRPRARPPVIEHLHGPVAGVIGNLSGNMDWPLLEEAVRQTPWLQWVMVGNTDMPIADRHQTEARKRVLSAPKVFCTGPKPYGELQAYARCLDVAVLPYLKKEPTWSGSSTRFYEHLAAGRPMIATHGFAELLSKPPLLELVQTPGEMVSALERLRDIGFQDGHETDRWEASKQGTWTARARSMIRAVEERQQQH